MLKIFLGKDSFSKNQAIRHLAKEAGAEITWFGAGDTIPPINELGEPVLFGPPRLYVLEHSFAGSAIADNPEAAIASQAEIIVAEDTLDKRKSATTKLLKDPKIEVREFAAPQGADLEKWVAGQAKQHNSSLTPKGLAALINALVFASATSWDVPTVDLWRFDNELQKLASYANGRPIDEQMVDALVGKNFDTEVWQVINAVASRDTWGVFTALANFFAASAGSDEKTKVIQLNALLADQFRNILMVQDFQERSVSDQEILQKTLWKGGRLFILKKAAGQFAGPKVRDILAKLESLDIELKTSSTPPLPILDLIVAQLVYN